MITTMEEVMKVARSKKNMRLCVCAAEDLEALLAAHKAKLDGLADPVLIGDKKKIIEIGNEVNIDFTQYEIHDFVSPAQAALHGVSLVSKGEGDVLMKGLINTTPFMQAVLNKQVGLRVKGRRLSHVGYFKTENYHKLMFITDGGINIAPDLKTKISIILNAIDLVKAFGIDQPKIALLSAFEKIVFEIQSTVDAAIIAKMSDCHQISGGIIDGPMSLDVAISPKSAKRKRVKSEVAGDADIFVVPDIEAGNILVKGLIYYAKASFGGLVLGARAPIVITSRADPSEESKLISIAGAMILADYIKNKEVSGE